MAADSGREQFRVWITPMAKYGFEEFARRCDLTPTALMEAIGEWCAEHLDVLDGADVGDPVWWVIDRGRQVQRRRRRRSGDATPPDGIERRAPGSPAVDEPYRAT